MIRVSLRRPFAKLNIKIDFIFDFAKQRCTIRVGLTLKYWLELGVQYTLYYTEYTWSNSYSTRYQVVESRAPSAVLEYSTSTMECFPLGHCVQYSITPVVLAHWSPRGTVQYSWGNPLPVDSQKSRRLYCNYCNRYGACSSYR